MTNRSFPWPLVPLLAVLLGSPAMALAGPPPLSPTPAQIGGGTLAQECVLPQTVVVWNQDVCVGALISPSLVVYSSVCGGGYKYLVFGQDYNAAGRIIQTADCHAHPQAGILGAPLASHFAYCRLEQPVTDFPVAPPAVGCELDGLEVGAELVISGFGLADNGDVQKKYWGTTVVDDIRASDGRITAGGQDDASICTWDTGAPGLLAMSDGSWRTAMMAVARELEGCGGPGYFYPLAAGIEWLEQDSGIDLTPCHDVDGHWAPTPRCDELFAGEVAQGMGTWKQSQCAETPRSGPSTSCGAPWTTADPEVAAAVEISSPSWGDRFAPSEPITVSIAASPGVGGLPVRAVGLRINGIDAAVDELEPWIVENIHIPTEGVYELVALAEDWGGNVVESPPVKIAVGDAEVPPEPEPDPGETSDGETSGDSAGLDDAGACSCDSTRARPLSALWLVVGVLGLGLTRRRRARR